MKTTTLAMMVASILLATPVLAEEEAMEENAMAEESMEGESFLDQSITWLSTDTYVGLQLGTVSHDTSTSGLIAALPGIDTLNSASIDDGGTGYRIFFGKRFMPHLSVEAGFADLGDIDANVDAEVLTADVPAYMQQLADNVPVAPAGLVFDAVGDWSFKDFGMEGDWAEKLSITGRLGLFLWETEVKYRANGVTYTGSDDGVDLHYGIGAMYRINEQFDIRFDWETYSATTDSSMIGLGVAWHF